MLTPPLALKVHEPYIRHQIADTESPRAYIDNTRLWLARMLNTNFTFYTILIQLK